MAVLTARSLRADAGSCAAPRVLAADPLEPDAAAVLHIGARPPTRCSMISKSARLAVRSRRRHSVRACRGTIAVGPASRRDRGIRGRGDRDRRGDHVGAAGTRRHRPHLQACNRQRADGRPARAAVAAPRAGTGAARDHAEWCRTRATAPLSRVVATAFLFGPDGTFLTSSRAPLDFTTLAPGVESPFVVSVPVSGAVSRYRVGFRTDDGRVISHVDRRAPESLAQK